MRKKIYYLSIGSALLLVNSISNTVYAENDFVIIRNITPEKIIYEKYSISSKEDIGISDLELWKELQGKEDIFNTSYNSSIDFRVFLLERGYAILKNPQQANKIEQNAQKYAQEKRLGRWGQENQSSPSPKNDIMKSIIELWRSINWKSAWDYGLKIVIFILGLGFISEIYKFLHKKYYIQRKFKLLIIGEPSSGKTSLLYSLIDPKIPKSQILQLTTSKSIEKKKKIDVIPRGKFEIIPEISDIPGSDYSSVWDYFIEQFSHGLIIVLSPYRGNGLQQNATIKQLDCQADIDRKYIDMQLGYVQAILQGGLGARQTHKPKVIILFISKFDLFSKYQPDDSSATSIRLKIMELFRDHIDGAKLAAKKSKCQI